MNFKIFLFTLCAVICLSCSSATEPTDDNQEAEQVALNSQKERIEAMAVSVSCSNSATCKYVPFGSKPCGGPWTYLAYNSEIDEENFLNEIADYNAKEVAFNIKWGIVSDCSVPSPPLKVECIDGVCTAIYQ